MYEKAIFVAGQE